MPCAHKLIRLGLLGKRKQLSDLTSVTPYLQTCYALRVLYNRLRNPLLL